MSAQGLLSSVFSCSLSPKTIAKRRLRQTRSLDPALMRHYGTDAEETSYKVSEVAVKNRELTHWKSGFALLLPNHLEV